jgi:predicted aspartyl protease
MNNRLFLGIAIRIGVVCLSVLGTWQRLQAESDIHFRLVDDTLIVVALDSGQGDRFDFVLDTGTDTTVVDPSIASRLSFAAKERIRVVSLGNASLAVRGSIPALSAGSLHVNNVSVLVKDLSNMRKLDSHIVGVLGQNFLSHFNYLIDYRKHLVRFESGDEIRNIADGDHVAIELTGDRMMVAAEAHSRRATGLNLLLDSGAPSVVLLRTASQTLNIPKETTALEETSDGQVELQKGRIPEMTVGSQTLHDVAVLLPSMEPSVPIGDGLLPTILFRAVYVNNQDGFVIFNPHIRKQ